MNKLKKFKYLFSFIFVISMMFMYCDKVVAYDCSGPHDNPCKGSSSYSSICVYQYLKIV